MGFLCVHKEGIKVVVYSGSGGSQTDARETERYSGIHGKFVFVCLLVDIVVFLFPNVEK